MYQLNGDWSLDADAFKRVVLAFNHPEAAAELLTGLTVDSYADLAEEDEDDPLVRTFYHALNPDLIES